MQVWVQAYDDNQTQMTLDGFLSFSQRFAKIKSRRLQKAVAGITGPPPTPPFPLPTALGLKQERVTDGLKRV